MALDAAMWVAGSHLSWLVECSGLMMLFRDAQRDFKVEVADEHRTMMRTLDPSCPFSLLLLLVMWDFARGRTLHESYLCRSANLYELLCYCSRMNSLRFSEVMDLRLFILLFCLFFMMLSLMMSEGVFFLKRRNFLDYLDRRDVMA
jgi:hypothetical protein